MAKSSVNRKLSGKKASVLVLAVCAVIFIAALVLARSDNSPAERGESYVEYEKGTVTQVMSTTVEVYEASDNSERGEQLLQVVVKSGQYKGETLLVPNYVSPLFGVSVKEGDSVTLTISTYDTGEHRATVFEYNRTGALIAVVVLFIAATVIIGGKTGVKSLLGLAITFVCLFAILLPLLMKGAPTVLTVFLVCAFITVVSFTILGGVTKKTVCAALGTLCGIAFAMLFAMLAQALTRIDGMRLSDVEPLLQLRQTGAPIKLHGLLVGGIIIAALGAVMDVAMSIASALTEVHAANPELGKKALFRSGMNIGRDMVGTMTNTLILAFLGSSFSTIMYLFSLNLQPYQLLSSAYLSIEVISGIASSIGLILSIPITALISAQLLTSRTSF